MLEAIKDLNLKNPAVAIQGFGNVGRYAALECQNHGVRVVAVNDVRGGIYQGTGLDIQSLCDHVDQTGSVVGFPGGQPLDEDIIGCDCDVLLPCALERAITDQNADSVKARLIVEGANGPTSLAADRILDDKGTVVVPGILANAGGVIVSYYEWVQDREGLYWEEENVCGRLFKKITNAYAQVKAVSQKRNLSLRKAAHCISLNKVIKAMHLRGVQ